MCWLINESSWLASLMNHVIWPEWVSPTNCVALTMLAWWIWLDPVCSGRWFNANCFSIRPERNSQTAHRISEMCSCLVVFFPCTLPQGIASGPCLQSSVLLSPLLLILLYFSRLTQIKGLCSPLQHPPSLPFTRLPSAPAAPPHASLAFSHTASSAKESALWSQLCQTIIKVKRLCQRDFFRASSDELCAPVFQGPWSVSHCS